MSLSLWVYPCGGACGELIVCMEAGPPSIFLNLNIAVAMSKQNQIPIPPVGGPVELDLDRCMKIATGNRWLSMADDLDPATVRAVLDRCYQILRAEAERA